MKLYPQYKTEIEKIISYYAAKYYKSIRIDKEDLIQELWLYIINKDFDTIGILYKELEHYCNRLYYNNNVRFGAKDHYTNCFEFSDFDESYIAYEQSVGTKEISYDSTGDIMFASLFKVLDEKSSCYVVVKAYLSGNYPELRTRYESIIKNSNLTDNQSTELESSTYNDDLIARYILGFKNGTHSGSFRSIRSKLKTIFQELCIY